MMTDNQPKLRRYAILSVGVALLTIALKLGAALLTGSVGLFSDAMESVVNLLAAIVALWALTVALRPADDEHRYGHGKVEYFSSGFEGALILVAAVTIAITAGFRLLNPEPLEQLGIGVVITLLASAFNFIVAQILLRAGKVYQSITLEADGHHLMTDVWTSAGVIVGVIGVQITGWLWLDPIIAVLVSLNIFWMGIKILRRSALGLMDTMLPPEDLILIEQVLDQYSSQGIKFHALRTRQAGARRFMSVHVLVPGEWSVQRAHDLVELIERDIHEHFERLTILSHIEPQDDPKAWHDTQLDRGFEASDLLNTNGLFDD